MMLFLLYSAPVKNRPHVTLSVALSLDGFMDDKSPHRREFSDAVDWAEIDRLRAESDAILVGANTVRKDNPKLAIKSEQLRESRRILGKTQDPLKITITRSGRLDAHSRFFVLGTAKKYVFCPETLAAKLQVELGELAEVRSLSEGKQWLSDLLCSLSDSKIERLFVEGGAEIHRAFLETRLFDLLRVAWAPFSLKDEGAVPFAIPELSPGGAIEGLRQLSNEHLGSMRVSWYAP